ncbi:hypothetical protein K491DRAFT_674870 [Lophiostoma macrostomum CBS 122681]|uniref:RING-type domain-containing protein n=1 Tax=Lophiostoma macrostomum CBS 122681 TaxID=1314788 RepID=A0A6A6TMD4_9PLEO|nr:hypothetical protein K491DRAFT_674870 [Lophiostoma macrostomum CBS 122681]
MALRLYNIPKLFQTYDIRAPETPPDPQEHCPFCFGKYRLQNGEESEEQCEPVQIYPCKHYVGKECIQQLIDNGMVDCQYCRTPVATLSSPVPRFIQWIAKRSWYTAQVDLVASHFEMGEEVRESVQNAHVVGAIRGRTFYINDAIRSWVAYTAAQALVCAKVLVCVVILQACAYIIFSIVGQFDLVEAFLDSSRWSPPIQEAIQPLLGPTLARYSKEAIIAYSTIGASASLTYGLLLAGFGNHMVVILLPLFLLLVSIVRVAILIVGWKCLFLVLMVNELGFGLINALLLGVAVWMARKTRIQ